MLTRNARTLLRMSVLLLLAAAVPAVGSTYLPPFEIPMQEGGVLNSNALMGDVVFVFLLPNCSGCDEVLDQLAELIPSYPDLTYVGVTAQASDDLSSALTSRGMDLPLLLDSEALLASLCIAFEAPLICTFSSGRLVSRQSWSFTQEDLAENLSSLASGVSVSWPTGIDLLWGHEAPTCSQVSIDDEEFTLGEFDGAGLIAFLGGDCSYCESMLPDLRRVASILPLQVVVSGGVAEDARVLALADTPAAVVLDPDWTIADEYRIQGVPTFVLVDETGEAVWIHGGLIDGLTTIAEAAIK